MQQLSLDSPQVLKSYYKDRHLNFRNKYLEYLHWKSPLRGDWIELELQFVVLFLKELKMIALEQEGGPWNL
jgi:hypothetical protein